MKSFLTILIVSILTVSSLNGIAIDDYHCKVPTCRDFHYGLKNHPKHDEYVDTCYDTVYALQGIPSKHGMCVEKRTGKLNSPCIYALANTIKHCMNGLSGLTQKTARYYCGYTLMKYCAVHLGLEHVRLNSDFNP